MIETSSVHKMPRGGPVTVAIEQRANDAAAQHSFESFLIFLGLEFRNDLVTARKAPYMQTFRIRWSTAKADEVWRVGFLDTLVRHEWFISCEAAKKQRRAERRIGLA